MKKRNKIAWGFISLIVGVLFLLKQLHVFPAYWNSWIFDYRNLFILIGGIFALTGKNKNLGVILMLVGAGLYLNEIMIWTKNFSNLIWPILLILIGVLLLTGEGVTKFFKKK